jgi:hypothetical protein
MKTIEISEEKFLKISYSALVLVMSGILAASTWMTTIHLAAAANTQAIETIQEDSESLKEMVIRIDKNVAEINAVLKK